MSATVRVRQRAKGRVAVVTLPGRFNYGNRLQCYAAYRVYERRGLIPECLVLRRPDPLIAAKDAVKRVLGRETSHPEDNMTAPRLAAFDRFNSRMRIREFLRVPRGLADEYEWFSAGSDQIWNPRFIEGYEDWYFLKVARPEQRLALAPSIGLSCLDEAQACVVREGVEGFAALSVRERRGAEHPRTHGAQGARGLRPHDGAPGGGVAKRL